MPTLVTGNPVRGAIARLAADTFNDSERRSLVVLGGSQGSLALNEAFLGCVERMPQLFSNWRIVHQTGARDVQHVRERDARRAESAPMLRHSLMIPSGFIVPQDWRFPERVR